MYSIQIVGAGYVGAEIARYFKSKGQKVSALVKTEARRPTFEKEGILPILADLRRIETLEKIPPAHFIVLCPAPSERDEASYRGVYLKGIGNFLEVLRNKPKPYLILYFSSTSVWRERGRQWVDESAEADPDNARSKILLDAEEQVLSSGFPAVIFRLAGIYGPGRNRLCFSRAQRAPAPEKDHYMNMIHRDDIVSAVPLLFKKAEAGSIYLGVDDEPVLYSEFSRWLNQRLKKEVLPSNLKPGSPGGKRCSNRRLRELGWKPRYPTFREGYEALIKACG